MSNLVFGRDRDPGVISDRQPKLPLSKRPNPMVVAHGRNPDARLVCADCVHLKWKGGGNRRYYGCELRGPFTNGPATDHLVNWPACSLLEPYEDGASVV